MHRGRTFLLPPEYLSTVLGTGCFGGFQNELGPLENKHFISLVSESHVAACRSKPSTSPLPLCCSTLH